MTLIFIYDSMRMRSKPYGGTYATGHTTKEQVGSAQEDLTTMVTAYPSSPGDACACPCCDRYYLLAHSGRRVATGGRHPLSNGPHRLPSHLAQSSPVAQTTQPSAETPALST